MAIDFTHPQTTDNYSTVYTPSIIANQTALGAWLESATVTITGTPPTNTKRWNNTSGLPEYYTGAAWSALPTGFALKAGDTFTGAMTFNNNVALQWKDTGATPRRILSLLASANIYVGDMDNAIAGSTLHLTAVSAAEFDINGTAIATVNSGGIIIQAAASQLQVAGSAEAVRLRNDSAYLSFFNTANTTRSGYIQAVAGSNFSMIAENGAVLNLGTNSTTRLTIDPSGNMGLNSTPFAWDSSYRAISVNSSGSSIHSNGGNRIGIGENYYVSATGATYANTAAAAAYEIVTGLHTWFTAPSGTGGTAMTATQVMTLDNTGNLLVGTTSSSWSSAGRGVVEINGSSSAIFGIKVGGTQSGSLYHDGSALWLNNQLAGALNLQSNNTTRLSISSAGVSTFSGAVVVAASAATPTSAITSSTAFTLNCALSNVFKLSMTGNVLAAGWTISNPQDGQTINIRITQDATGSRTLGWPTTFKWPGGVAGTISTVANAVDLLVITYFADTGFWEASLAKGMA